MPVYNVPGSEYDDDDQVSLPDTLPPPSPRQQTDNATDVGPNDKTIPAADPAQVATVGQSSSLYNWEELDVSAIIPDRDFSLRVLVIPHLRCNVFGYPKGGPCGSWLSVSGPGGESNPTRICCLGPGEQQAGFDMFTTEIRCKVLFDPADDRLIIINKALTQIYCKSVSTGTFVEIPMNTAGVITTGEWELSSDRYECHIQCKVLDRKPMRITQVPGTKRPAAGETHVTKRNRGLVGEDFNRITIPRGLFPNNPLLDIVRGEAIRLGTKARNYTLKLLEPIVDKRLVTSFKAEHSRAPGKMVVVKVIKPNSRRKESLVEAIETWVREYDIYSTLGRHYAIVPYLGSDARFNALFTEYIDAKPLTYHVKDQVHREFNGGTFRAWRILCDIASALAYLHSRRITHGDIQLANILFHPVRGALLANFNLSFTEGCLGAGNGLPWYQPPEFLGNKDAHGTAMDMWALGVVMMWTLGKIPMPESSKHWVVEHIHLEMAAIDMRQKAEARMEDWLAVVQAGSNTLQEEGGQMGEMGQMASLVGALVREKEQERIDAATLVEELAKFDLKD